MYRDNTRDYEGFYLTVFVDMSVHDWRNNQGSSGLGQGNRH